MRAEQPTQGVLSAEKTASLCLAVLIVVFFAVYYYGNLNSTGISPGDEYLTLDRTSAFSVLGDYGSVYTGNTPSFAKPPLQYWLGSLILASGGDIFYAIKLPSYVFSLLILVNSYFLTLYVLPERPIAAVFPPLILAVSGNFWEFAVSAMLDTGAAWFALLAVTTLIVAFDRPRMWYLWALAVFFGALQKAPVGLVFSLIVLAYVALADRAHARASLSGGGSSQFRAALVLALALMSLWPAWQTVQYGFGSVRYGVGEQMLERFAPISSELNNDFVWIDWLIGKNGRIFWITGALCSFFYLFRPREGAIAHLSAVAISFIVAMLLARGKVYDRYVLILYPFLATIVVYLVFRNIRNPLLAVAAMVAMFVVNGQYLYTRDEISPASSKSPPFAAQLENLKKVTTRDSTIVLCRGREPEEPSLSAVSYFASNGAPVVMFSDQTDPEKYRVKYRQHREFVGLCRERYRGMLEGLFAEFKVLDSGDDFIMWSARSIR